MGDTPAAIAPPEVRSEIIAVKIASVIAAILLFGFWLQRFKRRDHEHG